MGYPTKERQPWCGGDYAREAETLGERRGREEIVDDPDQSGIGRSVESQKIRRGICGELALP
jgi:hypothetical protein